MTDFKSRFAGALMGCAVGDAMGAPFEGRRRGSIPSAEHLLDGFTEIPGYPLGQYTDDTQMTLALAESLIHKEGFDAWDVADRFATLWKYGQIVGAGAACTEGVMKFINGIRPDRSGAPVGRAGNGTAMRASPIGLFYYDDPGHIVDVSEGQSVITHLDPRASAGASAVARAISLCLGSENLDREQFIGETASAAREHSPEFARYILELASKLDEDEDYALPWIATIGIDSPEKVGKRWPGGITPFVVSTVLAAFYEFLRHPDDWGTVVTGVISFGGDVDTTGAIVGAIAGARLGIDAIPPNLADTVLDREHILHLAGQLHDCRESST